MKLLDYLFTIESKPASSADASLPAYTVRLLPECPVYGAHFPGNPVTPGVCVIDIATELLELHAGCRFGLVAVTNAKYLELINPLAYGTVEYVFRKIDTESVPGHVKASVDVRAGEKTLSKLSLVYRRKQ